MPTDPKILCELQDQGISVIEPERQIGERLRDNGHFKQFILALKPKDRKTAYNKLLPFLKFKAKPYWFLLR